MRMKDNLKPIQETYNERMMIWPITEKSAGNKFHVVGWNFFYLSSLNVPCELSFLPLADSYFLIERFDGGKFKYINFVGYINYVT